MWMELVGEGIWWRGRGGYGYGRGSGEHAHSPAIWNLTKLLPDLTLWHIKRQKRRRAEACGIKWHGIKINNNHKRRRLQKGEFKMGLIGGGAFFFLVQGGNISLNLFSCITIILYSKCANVRGKIQWESLNGATGKLSDLHVARYELKVHLVCAVNYRYKQQTI